MSVLTTERIPRAFTPRQNREWRARGGVGSLPQRSDLQRRPLVPISLGDIPSSMPLIEEVQQTATPDPLVPSSFAARVSAWMTSPTGIAATTIGSAAIALGGLYLWHKSSRRRRRR